MSEDKAGREKIYYEYYIYSTPRFTGEPIDEEYEVHQVLHSWLSNGTHNFIIVFRRPFPKPLSPTDNKEKGDS